MPIHELISFKPTAAVLADPAAALAPATKFFSTVDGCSGLYFGASEEDKDVAFIVIAWETFEHHQAVLNAPGYPGVLGLTNTIADTSNSTILHVPFRTAPEPALGAPTTEVAVLTLKPGKSVADLDAALAALAPQVVSEPEGGCVGGTWGEPIQIHKEGSEGSEGAGTGNSKVVLFYGWASAKRHFEIVGQDKYKPFVADLLAAADPKFDHASFTKFA